MTGRLYSPFLRLFRSTTGQSLTPEAGFVGDQKAGVGTEATRVFGRNAQTPVIQRRVSERLKSTEVV
jgi:hypothetical protein